MLFVVHFDLGRHVQHLVGQVQVFYELRDNLNAMRFFVPSKLG
jgi:hypothetical protein